MPVVNNLSARALTHAHARAAARQITDHSGSRLLSAQPASLRRSRTVYYKWCRNFVPPLCVCGAVAPAKPLETVPQPPDGCVSATHVFSTVWMIGYHQS